MLRPAQTSMEASAAGGGRGAAEPSSSVGQARHNDEEPLSGRPRPSAAATAGYVMVALGHLGLLRLHSLESSATGAFFVELALMELALAFEAAIFAVGALGTSISLRLLTAAGRLRLLGAAMAWPWLLAWAAELGCRSGAVGASAGRAMVVCTSGVALLLTAFYVICEVLDSKGPAQCGDCLPGESVMSAPFRLDKADWETTGRAVFVPLKPRQGLYIGSGLALLGHLYMGFTLAHTTPLPPWLLLGAFAAMGGRWMGQLPKFKPREEGAAGVESHMLWRREGPRLLCRIGELLWIACCVLEVQRDEALEGWKSMCE